MRSPAGSRGDCPLGHRGAEPGSAPFGSLRPPPHGWGLLTSQCRGRPPRRVDRFGLGPPSLARAQWQRCKGGGGEARVHGPCETAAGPAGTKAAPPMAMVRRHPAARWAAERWTGGNSSVDRSALGAPHGQRGIPVPYQTYFGGRLRGMPPGCPNRCRCLGTTEGVLERWWDKQGRR